MRPRVVQRGQAPVATVAHWSLQSVAQLQRAPVVGEGADHSTRGAACAPHLNRILRMTLSSVVVRIEPVALGILLAAAMPSLASAAEEALPGATPAQALSEPEFYPWSENSDFTRVPKSFLELIRFNSLMLANPELMQFGLSEQFIQACRVTPDEVRRVNAAFAQAVQSYRVELGRHMESTAEPENLREVLQQLPRRGDLLESHTFQIAPFPKEVAVLRRWLEAQVVEVLGAERAILFWRRAPWFLDQEMSLNESSPSATSSWSALYSYVLMKPAQVEFLRLDIDLRFGATGELGASRMFSSAAAEEFAPEAMKPILERWRKAGPNPPVYLPPAVGPPIAAVAPKGTDATTIGGWDNLVPYVDLPKSSVGSFRILAVTPWGVVTREAAVLLGLTSEERVSVRDLYAEMRVRVEQLEKKHFEPTDALRQSFVLHPFPEERAALQAEWREKLAGKIGATRAGLFDHAVRNLNNPENIWTSTLYWQELGLGQIRINVTVKRSRDGTFTQLFEYQNEFGKRGSINSDPGYVADRWRHLISPEMLAPVDPPVAF